MAITPLPHPTPAGVVTAACAGLDAVAGSLWSARGAGELVAGVAELQRLKAKAAALEAELLAELEARQTAKQDLGWGSTVDWFTHLAGTTRRQGRQAVAHARMLVTERAATLDALREGTVSPEQASVVLEAIERLPLAEHVRRRGEQVLLAEAGRLNATDLHRAGRHLASVVDPDRDEREAEKALDREDRAAHLGRLLTVTEDGRGGIRIRGGGNVEDGAVLRAALLPLTKPVPGGRPGHLRRTARPTRPRRPDVGRVGAARPATPWTPTSRPPATEPGPGSRSPSTPKPSATGDTAGVGVTEDGLDLPGSTVRRLACDCDLIRVLLDAEGCVLDVGRTQRLVTPPIWTALVARDHHCAFPGCTRPPVMCHAHHIRHWIHGGPTSLDNLVLLCGHHHRTLHHTPWQVRLAHDRQPEFLPPPKTGRPPPHWIRHRSRIE